MVRLVTRIDVGMNDKAKWRQHIKAEGYRVIRKRVKNRFELSFSVFFSPMARPYVCPQRRNIYCRARRNKK